MLFRRGLWRWVGVALAVAAVAVVAVVAMGLRRSRSADVLERTLTDLVPEGSIDVRRGPATSTPFSRTESVRFGTSMSWDAYGAWARGALGADWKEQGASANELVFVRQTSADAYTVTIEHRERDTLASVTGRAD
jgi:hypothetical protein